MSEQGLTGPEARAIRERLGLRIEDVAGILALTPHVVEAWESGATRVPREVARELRWRDALAAREQAMRASGLSECDWVAAWHADLTSRPRSRRDFQARIAEGEAHAATCPVCRARAEFASTLPPLPDPPARGGATPLVRLKSWIDKRPEWLRAPLWLSIAFAALGAFRVVTRLLRVLGAGGPLDFPLRELAAIPEGAARGFAIGLVWSAFAPLRRRGGTMVIVANTLAILGILALFAVFGALRGYTRR